MVTNRFDVFLISLDPTRGSEMRKTRPCLIISPDEMNDHIRTVIVAPMTTKVGHIPAVCLARFKANAGKSSWTRFGRWIRHAWSADSAPSPPVFRARF